MPRPKACMNCLALVVAHRSSTATRAGWVKGVGKHLGSSAVLRAELDDLPVARRIEMANVSGYLRVIGHIFKSQNELRE